MNGDGWNWSVERWRKVVHMRVSELGLKKWKNSIENKSTLEWYREKGIPKYESFCDGSWGSKLLFNASSQSPEVNGRKYRWK